MCDVPSIAVFCSESIECFPGTGSKFFLKLLVTIPVAPIVIGVIVHFCYYYYLLQLSCHSVAVVLKLVHTKQMRINIHKRNDTKT